MSIKIRSTIYGIMGYVGGFCLPIEVLLLALFPNRILGGITLITAGICLVYNLSIWMRAMRALNNRRVANDWENAVYDIFKD